MKEYIILEEKEVEKLLTIPVAISVLERCFAEKSKGKFNALPKINIAGQNGSLRITPGESLEEFKAIGFRLYDVIRNDYSQQPQLIVVYDNTTGRMKGVVISQLLGAYRTAAINAVMQKHFLPEAIDSLGIIGTGYQAMIHAEMFDYLLKPKQIKIYGRTPENVRRFVKNLREKLGKSVKIEICATIKELNGVNSLLLATRSQESLLDLSIFTKKMVITTIGPKIRGKSEVSSQFAKSCDLIVTDSIEQVMKYGDDFFVEDLTRVNDFAKLLNDRELCSSLEGKILLCSVGMGGTEVALADELIRLKGRAIGFFEV